MKWSEFGPYVLPYVIGCPEPTMELHTKLAAITFCRRTLAWRERLDPASLWDEHEVELDAPPRAQIVKIKSVTVDGRSYPIVETQHGLELAHTGAPGEFAFTLDGYVLQVYPEPQDGAQVLADVALAPSLDAISIDSAFAVQHAQDMAHGAIAAIKLIPGQVFSDIAGSAVHQAQFESRIHTIAAKHGRGVLGAKMRSRATFL